MFHKDKVHKDGYRSACKICVAAYQVKNKEVLNEKQRNHYHNNKGLYKSYQSKNKEIIAENQRINYWKNKENKQAYSSYRRAKKLGNGGNHTGAEIKYLKEIQNYQCLMCNRKEPEIKLTFDHIVPISKGGGDGIGNGQMLCHSCNSTKNARFIDFRGIKISKRKKLAKIFLTA